MHIINKLLNRVIKTLKAARGNNGTKRRIITDFFSERTEDNKIKSLKCTKEKTRQSGMQKELT